MKISVFLTIILQCILLKAQTINIVGTDFTWQQEIAPGVWIPAVWGGNCCTGISGANDIWGNTRCYTTVKLQKNFIINSNISLSGPFILTAMADDVSSIRINGVLIGNTTAPCSRRMFTVPSGVCVLGSNTIEIIATDIGCACAHATALLTGTLVVNPPTYQFDNCSSPNQVCLNFNLPNYGGVTFGSISTPTLYIVDNNNITHTFTNGIINGSRVCFNGISLRNVKSVYSIANFALTSQPSWTLRADLNNPTCVYTPEQIDFANCSNPLQICLNYTLPRFGGFLNGTISNAKLYVTDKNNNTSIISNPVITGSTICFGVSHRNIKSVYATVQFTIGTETWMRQINMSNPTCVYYPETLQFSPCGSQTDICISYTLPKLGALVGTISNPKLYIVDNNNITTVLTSPVMYSDKFCFTTTIKNIKSLYSTAQFTFGPDVWTTQTATSNNNPILKVDSTFINYSGCQLKIKRTYPVLYSPNCTQFFCRFESLIQNFNFSNGFISPPQAISPDFRLIRFDSLYNFDCYKNTKTYTIQYDKLNFSNCSCTDDVTYEISIDCSCSPPDCPQPTKVNPYLNNLAGNWQAQNNFAYNTKRVIDPINPVRDGQYFDKYNSIMDHNGSYWAIQDKDNWVSKETNALIDFNGQSIESINPLKIPSSAKFSFKNSLTNHIASNASSQETFSLSNEDESMFISSKISRSMGNRDKFDVNEIELPLKPNSSPEWPFISNHWHKNIELVEQSKDEFHTGKNSLKVKPSSISESYAYTQYYTCESQSQNNQGNARYCASEPSISAGLDITRVNIGSLNNTSTCSSLAGSMGNASGVAGSYSDYTSSFAPTKLNKGQSYNMTVNFDKCGSTNDALCHVFFDWNQDGDFADLGELYTIKSSFNNSLSAIATISIPSTALVGKTRMRVIYQIGSLPPSNTPFITSFMPCLFKGFSSVGETEDYLMEVLDSYEPSAPKETYTVNNTDVRINSKSIVNEFSLQKDKDYLLSYWIKDNQTSTKIGYIDIIDNSDIKIIPNYPIRPMQIEGWHKIEKVFRVSSNKFKLVFFPTPDIALPTYFDDVRIQPLDASMKAYVYDERTQKLVSELDENNYATFYDYDDEGQLIRVRKETERGIMTIKESRKSLKQ